MKKCECLMSIGECCCPLWVCVTAIVDNSNISCPKAWILRFLISIHRLVLGISARCFDAMQKIQFDFFVAFYFSFELMSESDDVCALIWHSLTNLFILRRKQLQQKCNELSINCYIYRWQNKHQRNGYESNSHWVNTARTHVLFYYFWMNSLNSPWMASDV